MDAITIILRVTVNQGDVIGYVGSSGTSTSPHLHMEMKKNGKHVDPAKYFDKD